MGFPVFAQLPSHPLVAMAEQKEGECVRYALDNGVQVGLTSDGKSYYLLWFPQGTDPQNPPPILATMHGHDGCAFVDFSVWHRFLKARGYGFFAIQWWLGKGEDIHDYLLPNEIYRVIDEVFHKLNVKPGAAMLQGFSRGATNIYAVAAIEQSQKNNYFSLFVANAGRAKLGLSSDARHRRRTFR